MRRSRSALTAWPAFADLMTVLAVLGLAIAGVASLDAPDGVLSDRIRILEAELVEAEGRVRTLKAELEEAQKRIEYLEGLVTKGVLGSVPCLGAQPGSLTAPVPLLRILVDSGYLLTRLWPPEKEADVAGIPRLGEALAHGLMQEGDLQDYARGMYAYGNDDDTYDGPCRFWVELRKGESASHAAFARAYGLVNRYFLFTNSSEANRWLTGTE